MPKFDGTGPRGKGPQTGRGFGPCDNKNNFPNQNEDKILEKLEAIEKRLKELEEKNA